MPNVHPQGQMHCYLAVGIVEENVNSNIALFNQSESNNDSILGTIQTNWNKFSHFSCLAWINFLTFLFFQWRFWSNQDLFSIPLAYSSTRRSCFVANSSWRQMLLADCLVIKTIYLFSFCPRVSGYKGLILNEIPGLRLSWLPIDGNPFQTCSGCQTSLWGRELSSNFCIKKIVSEHDIAIGVLLVSKYRLPEPQNLLEHARVRTHPSRLDSKRSVGWASAWDQPRFKNTKFHQSSIFFILLHRTFLIQHFFAKKSRIKLFPEFN